MRLELSHADRLFAANRELAAEAARLQVSLDEGAGIEGLIDLREGECLYLLARRAGALGHTVEIGSLMGRSTWYLARGLEDASSPYRVLAVDPHLEGTRAAFEANVARSGIAGRVEPRYEYSAEAAAAFEGPVGVLWIDGDHSYEGVRRDFELWFPKLAAGGWVAFHDTVTEFPGTTRLVREVLRRDDVERIGLIASTVYARKVPPGLHNRLRALPSRLAFELVNRVWQVRWQRGSG